jgi:2-oxoglutarate ferredoxin oxidoreductase subunit gamma
MFYNSTLVEPSSVRGDIEILGIPTTELAVKLGNAKVSNMVMLGAFIRISNLISFKLLQKNLPEILGAGKSRLLKINRDAFQAGFNYIKE